MFRANTDESNIKGKNPASSVFTRRFFKRISFYEFFGCLKY